MIVGIDAHNLEGNRTGVGRYLINLLQQWSKFKIEYQKSDIKFILYFKDKIPADLPKPSLAGPKSDLFESRLLKVGSTAKFIHWDLCRAAKKDKIDILFCPGYVAPVFFNGKIALVLHDIIYEAHPQWFNWKSSADKILLKWVSRISARKAAVIFVPSDFSKKEVIKYYKVDSAKVVMIYDAADFGSSETGQSPESIKAKYGIKNEFVFYVGSIFNRRHLPAIISAFSRIAADLPGLQLLLAGKNHTRPFQDIDGSIQEINNKLRRQAILRVDFINGYDYDLELLYSACAFFIWLSDYEGFGLPVLEALSAGAPVITSRKTSLIEVAGNAAFFIDNNLDDEEIYQAMKRIIEDKNLRDELIKKGRDQAARFSWKKCAEETLDNLISKA